MLSYYQECYKGTSAYNDATAMPVILENGRKVFGPPHEYCGSRPSHMCELFVNHIPPHLDELGFLVWLHRVGQVYAFRLMMDTGSTTRGYAFVRYCNEKDASAAFELLKYLFVDGERLKVYRSQGKNRLFVSGIPRQLPITALEDGFKLCFPTMKSCTAYPVLKSNLMPGRENEANRGFAFIEFEDHEMALAAKKRLNTGRIGMWGADLKIQWAKPKEVQLSIGSRRIFESSLSSELHSYLQKPNDYCAKLRLYCLANNLCIPIILYGSCFRPFLLQYAGVLIKYSFTGLFFYFLFEIPVDRISDIHLLICEITVKLIEEFNGDLQQNAVIRVLNDSQAEMVYTFKHCDELKSLNIQNEIKFPNIIVELATSLQILGLQNHEQILFLYKRSFLTKDAVATFCLNVNKPFTQYCSVLPKFRNNAKLNNNFNDFEIVLILLLTSCSPDSCKECTDKEFDDNIISMGSEQQERHRHHSLQPKGVKKLFTLKSQRGNFGIKYILRFVDYIGLTERECYHPEQRVNSNPIWIDGHSYQQSIYN